MGWPLYVWMPPYVWMSHVCLDAPHMVGCTPHVWMAHILRGVLMPPIHLYTPICLDAHCTYTTQRIILCQTNGCPYTPYIWISQYVWMPPVCLDVTRMFEHPLYLDVPICLDTSPVCLDAPPYVWTHPLYVWMPQYV